ncbi:glycoside hydrolase family 35 protein [Ceratobasidium sp. AG-Ba]|nr:glycoside hydrolase family 35 protein [Ceratobasidium sp. AG-Ba]
MPKSKSDLGLDIQTNYKSRRTTSWSKRWLALPLLATAALYHSSHFCKHEAKVVHATEHFRSNGRTELVQWDGKSLVVKGQRIFLWSGEFHTFRLPAPELWGDILEKTKAAGFNAISVYVHWGLVNPAPGEFDFTGFRALDPLFKLAMKNGLWVVLRPGPYINAEVSAGGIPHWVTSEVSGHLRTNNTDYAAAWEPYVDAIADIVEKGNWQIGDKTGGPVIAVQLENEYLATRSPGNPGKAPYMAALAKRFVDRGIVVPLTYNDAYMGGNYATGPVDTCEEGQEEGGDDHDTRGKGRCGVEVYGVDSYPQRFDCSNPDIWNPVVTTYHDFHTRTNPHEPLYIPEFQGGSFDAWGGGIKHGWAGAGYEACRELTGAAFAQVFNLGLWANNAKMINLYMLYGGTTWGYMPFPGVYTSYDYGAALTETRLLTDKYTELKRQGLFLRSVPEFYAAEVAGNSTDSKTSPTVQLSDPSVFGTLLRNAATGAEFYIVRHLDSTSKSNTNFRLHLPTSHSAPAPQSIPLTLPSITLTGRASKVLLRNVVFGASRLAWSTASIFFAGRMGNRDVLFLHGPTNEGHEFALPLRSHGLGPEAQVSNHIRISQHGSKLPLTIVTVLPGNVGLTTIFESAEQLVLFADSDTAGGFWAPVLAPQAEDSLAKPDPYANFFQFGTNASVIVGGPYLVRTAELSSSGELSLRGDLEKESMLFVIAELGAVRRVFWNGIPVDTMLNSNLESSVLKFTISPKAQATDIKLPALVDWKYRDSLPEVEDGYDDSDWIIANHTTTNIPQKPYFGDNVLYGCDYGFCEGAVIWRGRFDGGKNVTGAKLIINGGNAFAASVWLNGVFLQTTYGNSSNNHNNIAETNQFYAFPSDLMVQNHENVLTVVQDNMGLEMTVDWAADASKSPRGIRGYELSGGSFKEWRVQGKKGGYTRFQDKTRGVQNGGGLYGEREGWHLPGYDDSEWDKVELESGIPGDKAGVGWFRTSFKLDMPKDYDIPLSFEFEDKSSPYRALLFVNGWLMGRRIANLGPQFKFPVPQGILNYQGQNTVALVIWNMENVALSPRLKLTVEGTFDSGYDFSTPS